MLTVYLTPRPHQSLKPRSFNLATENAPRKSVMMVGHQLCYTLLSSSNSLHVSYPPLTNLNNSTCPPGRPSYIFYRQINSPPYRWIKQAFYTCINFNTHMHARRFRHFTLSHTLLSHYYMPPPAISCITVYTFKQNSFSDILLPTNSVPSSLLHSDANLLLLTYQLSKPLTLIMINLPITIKYMTT